MLTLNTESTIASIVESVLPRFSDHNLGLQIGIRMDVSDYGYGKDGKTKEREELRVCRHVYLLFVRPSNYTKIFVWSPKEDAVGLDVSPDYKEHEWFLECDHDSYWRYSITSAIHKYYYPMLEMFRGRIKNSKEMNPYRDLSEYHSFNGDGPKLVELTTFNQINPTAERYSDESKRYTIGYKSISHSQITQVRSSDPKSMSDSGLLIQGSKDHERYIKSIIVSIQKST